MVLYKRKPVQFLEPPTDGDDEDAEVWQVAQTGEFFTSYEDYLERIDFYNQRKFNDEITGHSGLTFFEAFKSELTGGREVEAAFPEALKGPILRKVQFETISRLDSLVDKVYDEFKADYFPGEEVTINSLDGDKNHGTIRDKTAFGPRPLPDGTLSPPVTRYQVILKDSGEETNVTSENLCRDRGVFTKAMLRSFIKKTVFREAWNGAPWLVKQEYASQYYIDTKIPSHLRYDTKVMERKLAQAQKRASNSPAVNGDHISGPVRLPELKPAPGQKKSKQKWAMGMAVHGAHAGGYAADGEHDVPTREPSPPPPPPPKYPIEDLALPPQSDRVRPPLQYMCQDPPVNVDGNEQALPVAGLNMKSVGPLLEVWDTLNVYCEVFQLDSFTFDDFVEALEVAGEQHYVQMVEEIHCAVLKVLVDSEADGGKVRIALPELGEQDSEEEEEEGEEEDEEEEDSRQETPEPQSKPPARATRSSLAKLEAERLKAEEAAAEEEREQAELATKHQAEAVLKGYDWIEALRKREFPNGGWELMVVGLLHQLSKKERKHDACEELLYALVPPGIAPSQESVQQRYAGMDINQRVQLLQVLCMLTTETKALRDYMEECSETMTNYRKEKIEWQRQKRYASDELRRLNEQRKVLLPENMPPSPPSEEAKTEDVDIKMSEVDDSQLENGVDAKVPEEEDSRSRRRASSKSSKSSKQKKQQEEQERKMKLKKEEEEKTKKKEAATKGSAQSKQFIKLLKDIQKQEDLIKKCEDEVSIIDNDLREADCPRTRVLGKDRFWNRYYWFERNGMPYGGLPTSSTANAAYANGCIWVQGPDDLEREGYIDVPEELQSEYKDKFGMTIPERKKLEEGATNVFNANQWGYISEPEHVDALIHWLDLRGFNELKLRKELVTYHDKIKLHMENRQKYLTGDDKNGVGAKGPDDVAPATRTSSRIRDKTPETRSLRCVQWENGMALENLGHLHSEVPPPPRGNKKKNSKPKREATEAAGPVPAAKSRKR